jgi:hypothetical protein
MQSGLSGSASQSRARRFRHPSAVSMVSFASWRGLDCARMPVGPATKSGPATRAAIFHYRVTPREVSTGSLARRETVGSASRKQTDGIPLYVSINGGNEQRMSDPVTDNHPIKGIAMMVGKRFKHFGIRLLNWQRLNAMFGSISRQVGRGWLGQA